MDATLKADHANQLFDKMSNLVSEAILQFTEDGLEVTTADPAMVAMIQLEVPESSFTEYEVDVDDEEYEHLIEEGEDGLLVGINLENLAMAVNLFDEEINLTVEENQLVLTEGDDRFELPVLNLSTDDIPSLDALDDHIVKAELLNSQLKTLTDKVGIASDSTYLTLDDEGNLEVEAGGDQISVDTSFSLQLAEDLTDEETDTEPEATSMFALEYLNKARQMFNKLDTCNKTEIMMGNDFPLYLTHDNDRENLRFVLAPRIEEE